MLAIQTATATLGSQLVFFLFLLIPGYVTLKAYIWANITLDNISRLDKIIYLTIGGFSTIVIVSAFRNLGTFSYLWSFIPISLPSWLVISVDSLRINTISSLTMLEAFSLIATQSIIGFLIGFIYGASRWISDPVKQTRRDLKQPWEMAYNQTLQGDKVTIITTQNREIHGIVEQMSSPPMDSDILLSNSKEIVRDSNGQVDEVRDIGKSSYHHHQDVSRIEFERDLVPEQEPHWQIQYLQKIVDLRNSIMSLLNRLSAGIFSFFKFISTTTLSIYNYISRIVIEKLPITFRHSETVMEESFAQEEHRRIVVRFEDQDGEEKKIVFSSEEKSEGEDDEQ